MFLNEAVRLTRPYSLVPVKEQNTGIVSLTIVKSYNIPFAGLCQNQIRILPFRCTDGETDIFDIGYNSENNSLFILIGLR